MFDSGVSWVLVSVIYTNRKDYKICVVVGWGLFTDFCEMVGICSGVAVYLYVWVSVFRDMINIRVTQDEECFVAFKNPILNLVGGSG